MAQCNCVFWQQQAGIRRCLSKDFPRAVSRSNSSMCSHVDHQETYGFIFKCEMHTMNYQS